MQRYFAINKTDNQFTLNPDDLHHITKVMRMKPFDQIEVVFEGQLYLAVFNDSMIPEAKELIPTIINVPQVTLAAAVIKETNWNYLLQKATELNALAIIPINTKHSIINLTNDKKSKKIIRWQKIVKEASEQTKRLDIPPIFDIIDIDQLDYEPYDLCLYGHHQSPKTIKQVISELKPNTSILFVSGPEGGFTEAEMTALDQKGFVGINMGANVFRAETIPLVVLSMINYEQME